MTTASPQIADEQPIAMTSMSAPIGFAELYERHYETVFRAALRVTGNPADAEDVLQTVFLRVLARGGDVEVAPLPAAYFRRAAVNAAVDLLRRRAVSCRVGLRRSGAARRRRVPFAAEGAAPARHRHPRKRGRGPVPAASRRGAVDRRAGRDVPAGEEQRVGPAPPDPAPVTRRVGAIEARRSRALAPRLPRGSVGGQAEMER